MEEHACRDTSMLRPGNFLLGLKIIVYFTEFYLQSLWGFLYIYIYIYGKTALTFVF